MAQIPRKYIDSYTKSLNKLSADAQKRLADDLAKINFDGNIATIRDVLAARMEFYCGPYTDMAAIVAAEFYDGLRKFQIGAALGALAESGREPIATEKAVRAIVQGIVDGKPKETVVKKLVDRVDFEIKRSAGECVYRNGKRDPLKPRFARVPSGSETCRFCIMLASRGFVYHSKETAGEGSHYHANCDCRIVPGFDGETMVAGYDPDALYDQWKHPEKYPELQEARNARRRELYAEKRSTRRTDGQMLKTQRFSFGGTSENANIANFKLSEKERFALKKYLKGDYGMPEPMSFDGANRGKCNPNYGKAGFDKNCFAAVIAFELRRRGFNVEAMPKTNSKLMKMLSVDPRTAWKDRVSGGLPASVDYLGYDARQGVRFLEENIKVGERHAMAFHRKDGLGHVVSVERDRAGELLIYDPQQGLLYQGEEVAAFMASTRDVTHLFRVDDAILDVETATGVVKLAFDESEIPRQSR